MQQDQFDRSLPTFIQLLDLSDSERDDYWKVMGMVEQGEEVDLFVDDHPDNERNNLGSGSSTTTRLNNKVLTVVSSETFYICTQSMSSVNSI